MGADANMTVLNTLADLLDNRSPYSANKALPGFGYSGVSGYALGAISFFVFARLFDAVPPGIVSFVMVFTFMLCIDIILAAMTHLFLSLTGVKEGSAAMMFSAFGCSNLAFTFLLPLGIISKAGTHGAFLSFAAVLLLALLLRIKLLKRIYSVSFKKALLFIWLPYAVLSGLVFIAGVYSVIWMVWLIL